MNIFSKNLLMLRKQKNLSQTAVANAINIVLRTYQRYESGERIPDIEMACHLARYLAFP